jgi:GNAT superfamily N-acetyltransferase
MPQRLSPESVYYRYLQYRRPTLAEIAAVCQLAPERGAGFVATLPAEPTTIVGVAYYVREAYTLEPTAEPGILVEDRFQAQGIGRRLWQQLQHHAQANGLRRLRVLPHPNNQRLARLGLPVSFAALTPPICTVSGNMVTLITTGTCTVQAGPAGNANFNPAPPVAQSFAGKSSQKSDQRITFGKPADRGLGDLPFALSATASSGLPVAFTGNTPTVCTVSDNLVTLLAVGVCSITSMQDGNAMINRPRL